MKFIQKKDRLFEFSFDKKELKSLLAAATLIYKGMPEKDLGLLASRTRLKEIINCIKEVLLKEPIIEP